MCFSFARVRLLQCIIMPKRDLFVLRFSTYINPSRDCMAPLWGHFQMGLSAWILFSSDSNITELCSLGSIFQHSPALVKSMAVCRTSDKPISEPVMVYWQIYAINSVPCVTRKQHKLNYQKIPRGTNSMKNPVKETMKHTSYEKTNVSQ